MINLFFFIDILLAYMYNLLAYMYKKTLIHCRRKSMGELEAIYYGQVELISGIHCDGYVLSDETAVMSERGTADLLNMDHAALLRMVTNGIAKSLEPFVDKGWSMVTKLVKVVAKNSPYKDREIVVYTSETIESLIRTYALALAHNSLRENQRHIGQRCVILQCALTRTALESAIKEACGFIPEIQKTVQRHYQDVIFSLEKAILYNALQNAYPKREAHKYSGLMATCFKYCYEDILGKEQYQRIKRDKQSYPVHQYIEEPKIRQLCVTYINTLASQIAIRECPTAQAREYTRKIMEKFLAT